MPASAAFDEKFRAWITAIGDFGPILSASPIDVKALDRHRQHYVRVMARNATPDDVAATRIGMAGVPATLFTPQAIIDDRAMLYIHGGGYVAGAADGYGAIAGHYARLLKARVYVPDYRLAPEHPHPAPVDDVFSAYKWLIDQGQAPRSLVLSGDSAGGAMVVTIMVRAREAGLPLPAAGVAISPWANLEHTGASMTTRDGRDPQANLNALSMLARMFLGDTSPADGDVSPVFADVAGLPPILVQIGENEVMLSDAVRLAGHLGENRVRVSLEVWPDMFHVWHLFADDLPEGREALENAAAFLGRELGRSHAEDRD